MRASVGWVLAALLVVVGSMVFGAQSPAVAFPSLNSVLYGGGCGKPLQVKAVSESGGLLATRTLVNAKKGTALEPHGVSSDDKQFIFSSYDCATELHSLYIQSVVPRPVAREILRLPTGWGLVDASWDLARSAPVVLIRDPDFNYQINILSSGQWVTLWSGSTTTTGGNYLDGLESRSGREAMVWGSSSSGWQLWRLRSWGSLSAELSGPGQLHDLSSWSHGNVNGLAGSEGSWACDWDARGTISEAVTQKKCAVVPQGAAYGGVFTEAPGSGAFWFHLSPAHGSNFMVKVTCPDLAYVGCGNPIVSDRRTSPLGVTSSAMTLIYLSSVKQIKKLGASTI